MLPCNSDLKEYARILRKNMTEAERLLWSKVRGKQIKGFRFHRQKIIGDFIVDFYCHIGRLVIEVDGGQHYTEDGQSIDALRDGFLKRQGLKVLRFSNRDVLKSVDGVLEKIYESL
ncbi:MAG: endonuclease domain-containing protein [Thermodesulfobacteriota bacterium]